MHGYASIRCKQKSLARKCLRCVSGSKEAGSLQFGNADSTVPLDFVKQSRLLRAYLRRDELLHRTQTTIDSYFR
jgi:hypothetical protein